MLKLQAHTSNSDDHIAAFVSYALIDLYLIVNFEIQKESLYINEEYAKNNWDNWGLWNFDVAEVFLTRDINTNHYLELQVTPLQQKLALEVFEPRMKFEKINPEGVEVISRPSEGGFQAKFKIPVDMIPGKLNTVLGNFHCCLYKDERCNYFSLKPNSEEKADFHRPDNFIKVGEIDG